MAGLLRDVAKGFVESWRSDRLPVPVQPRPAVPSEILIGSPAPDAITLGRIVEPHHGITHKIRHGGEQHTLIFGKNGAGKGTRILVPNLLQNVGASVVVVDPKGELAAITAPFRRTLGPVAILNPFGVLTDWRGYEDLKSCGYNPLAALDPDSPDLNTKASQLGDALIKVEGKEPHFPESARALVAALIMFTVMEARRSGRTPTMARVRELICMASAAPAAENNFEGVGLPKLALDMMRRNVEKTWRESNLTALRNKLSQFIDWNREISSIASTAKIQTEPFDDWYVANDMKKDGIDFRELKRRPCTVYIVLPPEMMQRHARWLRLVLTAALQSVLRARRPNEPRVYFWMDEFFMLGHLEIIETTWAAVRGYGISMMPILQDMNQLKKLYPATWETFVGMAGAVGHFGPNDMTTAEYLSRRGGDLTREVESLTRTTGTSSTFGDSSSVNSGIGPNGETTGSSEGFNSSVNYSNSEAIARAKQKAALLTPNRIMGLPPGFMLYTVDGLSSLIPAYAPPYYDIRQCKARARQNPYFLG